jgi:hypothetical protein
MNLSHRDMRSKPRGNSRKYAQLKNEIDTCEENNLSVFSSSLHTMG